MVNSMLAVVVFASFSFLGAQVQAGHDHDHATPAAQSALTIPAPLQAEHQELHQELAAAIKVGGETGKAAQAVADKLHAHFLAEEEFALPPLGLLKSVAEGKPAGPAAAAAIEMSGKLKSEYQKMLGEHQEIKKLLADLQVAAKRESHPEAEEFARKLALHAETEEAVLYPATLLLGEYLKTAGHAGHAH